MAGEIGALFALNACVIVGLALALWIVAASKGDPSFIDGCWGYGFVVIAWVSYAAGDGRDLLLPLLASAWGLRLGTYLFWRWRQHGVDARYAGMLKKADNPRRYMLQNIFLFQAVLMLIVSLPLQFGQVYGAGSTALRVVGAAVALLGIAFESTGDFQLTRFKANAANKGKVMDRGLWRFTRHPNYFGDFCVWWGLFLVSLSNPVTALAAVGPVVMSILLMRYSGVGPLEKQLHRTKPEYKEYVARTSAFFPAPPK